MSPAIQRAWSAFTLRSDFRLSYWKVEKAVARNWLIAAFISNVVAQVLVGRPGTLIINSLSGLLTLAVFWYVPARLGAGVGALLVLQSIGSVILILIGHLIGIPFALIESAAWLWSIYCTVANVLLILKYVRTPKTQMP